MHTNNPDHFFISRSTQRWERKRYGRAGYRRTQAICEQSRAIPANPVSSPVILQDTHAQTQSPVPERLPFCPLCLLTGLLWGYHSNLNYFASAHTNRELHEDGPPNKLEEKKRYQTNRTLGLSKQARERHDGVPVCDREGWVLMGWFSKEKASWKSSRTYCDDVA